MEDPAEGPVRSHRARWSTELGVAAGLYLLCVLVYFAPVLGSLGEDLIGPSSDNMQYQWVMWWASETFGDPSREYLSPNVIFYPEGMSLLQNDSSFYNVGLSLLLRPWLSRAATYNALMLATFVIAALGAYLLIREWVDDFGLAVIGGFIYGFNPSHYAHSLHHLSVSSSQFIPFFVLFFVRGIRNRTWFDVAAATVCLVLSALCNWNYLVFLTFFVAFAYAYLAWQRSEWWMPDVVLRCGVLMGTTGLALAPFLLPMIIGPAPQDGVRTGGHDWYIADLTAFFVPHPNHLLGGSELLANVHDRYRGNDWEATVYLGLVNLAVVAIALRRKLAIPLRYVWGSVPFVVLALGTNVTLLGKQLPILLPYEVMQHVPLLTSSRVPSRWVIFVYLFLAILVAHSLKELLASPWFEGRRPLRSWVLAGLAALIVLDYTSLCRVVTPVELPPAYAVMEPSDETYGLLDLPGGTINKERYMMYQTLHGVPIVGGMLSRKTKDTLIDRLAYDDPPRLREQLAESRVRYVVMHKDLENPCGAFITRDELAGEFPTIFDDPNQTVYAVY